MLKCNFAWVSCFTLMLWGLSADLSAAELRVLADGEAIGDSRLEPLKDLDGYFPFQPSPSLPEWQQRPNGGAWP